MIHAVRFCLSFVFAVLKLVANYRCKLCFFPSIYLVKIALNVRIALSVGNNGSKRDRLQRMCLRIEAGEKGEGGGRVGEGGHEIFRFP